MGKHILSLLTGITLLSLLASCCKAIFNFRTIVNNPTSKAIELRIFSQGQITEYKIAANTTLFTIENALSGDSLHLLKDNQLQEIHYSGSINKASSIAKVRLFNDSENLLNVNASGYQQSSESLDCDGQTTILTYTFK